MLFPSHRFIGGVERLVRTVATDDPQEAPELFGKMEDNVTFED
jgi:hypothetical protein